MDEVLIEIDYKHFLGLKGEEYVEKLWSLCIAKVFSAVESQQCAKKSMRWIARDN